MPQTAVSIIGAGIAGLTLGRCLLKRGIPVCLYEKGSSSSRHNYGITLHASSYRPLLDVLGIDEVIFKRTVAVDRQQGGIGNVGASSGSFRANRRELERLLQEGLKIHWEKGFDNFEQVEENRCIVAADGPNSVVRKMLLPGEAPKVLPYVAFNGKRWIPRKHYEHVYAPAMNGSNAIELKRDRELLSISINDHEEYRVSISWTYSRPARTDSTDPLHKPDRTPSEARHIPLEFFHEISNIQNLPQPFADVFNPAILREDRVLHWLMRSILLALPDLKDLAAKKMFMIGDAVHAEPILGGEGANTAITDGVQLAECIAEHGPEGVPAWYKARYPAWQESVLESERLIARMHASSNL